MLSPEGRAWTCVEPLSQTSGTGAAVATGAASGSTGVASMPASIVTDAGIGAIGTSSIGRGTDGCVTSGAPHALRAHATTAHADRFTA
jgi:hypothetical protein